jgi:hypothetical protein
MNKKVHKHGQAMSARVRDLWPGHTATEIAAICGIARSTVLDIAARCDPPLEVKSQARPVSVPVSRAVSAYREPYPAGWSVRVGILEDWA